MKKVRSVNISLNITDDDIRKGESVARVEVKHDGVDEISFADVKIDVAFMDKASALGLSPLRYIHADLMPYMVEIDEQAAGK